MRKAGKNRLRWWQIALISIAVSALGSLSSLMSSRKEKKLYNRALKQAPWAPPSWVFGPAWTINNYFLMRALRRILESRMPEKKKLLMLQAGIWFIFFTFNYVYFRKRSIILAAMWTINDHVFALASFLLSFKSDKKLATNFIPLTLWTGFASTLATYQALKNPDPLLKIPAPLD